MKTADNVLYQDFRMIADSERYFQDGKQALQNILDKFNALGVGNIQDFGELEKLIQIYPGDQRHKQQIEAFIESKMANQISENDLPKLGLFRLKKSSFVTMLEKPDATEFINTFGENYQQAAAALPLAGFEKGKIVMDKAKHAGLIKTATITAETKAEKEVIARLKAAAAIFLELVESGVFTESEINRLCRTEIFKGDVKVLQPNPYFFQQIKGRITNN